MKGRMLFAVVLAILLFTLPTSSTWGSGGQLGGPVEKDHVIKGNTAKVPGTTWVTVAKKVEIGYGVFFYQGEKCDLRYGGVITAVGADGDLVLARYTAAGEDAFGCPAGPGKKGTLFFISQKDFLAMTAKYEEVKAARQKEVELVKRLLAQ